jgi:hypothetical protein
MSSAPTPVTAAKINAQFVLNKCEYFTDVQLWPITSVLDPVGFLENFTPDEAEYAVHLLNAFVFMSDMVINHMFMGAFWGLSRLMKPRATSLPAIQNAWRIFMDSVIVSPVTGETPSVTTDSGILFTRKARDFLGIDEERILTPEKTLERVYQSARPIVFVDDFVGSGIQFVETWRRLTQISGGPELSFERLAAVRGGEFYYCPLVCTQAGYEFIGKSCPEVRVSPAHILPNRYSVFDSKSLVWPPELMPGSESFLRVASKRAGIPDLKWRGFHSLGLTLAFAHSTPDATLPIFSSKENGWKPLVKSA